MSDIENLRFMGVPLMTLRESGLIREIRSDKGQTLYRVQTAKRVFDYTAPQHASVEALVRSRAYACAQLESQMASAGVTIDDLIPSTDPRGVNLR